MGKLTVKMLEALQPRASAYKRFDEQGLYIHVTTAGAQIWRMKYSIDGREKLLTFGRFPTVSLADARRLRDEALAQRAAEKDPAIERKKVKVAAAAARSRTLEVVCREWHSVNTSRWSKTHASEVIKSLENEVFPRIGNFPIAELTSPVVLDALQPLIDRGAIETAHRVRQRLEAAIAYANAKAHIKIENVAATSKAALPAVSRVGRQPAVIKLDEVQLT